ncbi:MAG: hypothetical protein J0H57_01175, partial [Rhodospirillales bacterium]|nr:hypothetical protein [Rhodospirillales bacterium]
MIRADRTPERHVEVVAAGPVAVDPPPLAELQHGRTHRRAQGLRALLQRPARLLVGRERAAIEA